MNEKQILLEIEGPDAKVLADDLCEEINAQFDLQIRPRIAEPETKPAPETRNIDPGTLGAVAGVAAAVLAIPGAILAGLEIKERLDKKKRFEEIVTKGKQRIQNFRITTLRFRIDNREFEFEETAFSEICDEANRED